MRESVRGAIAIIGLVLAAWLVYAVASLVAAPSSHEQAADTSVAEAPAAVRDVEAQPSDGGRPSMDGAAVAGRVLSVPAHEGVADVAVVVRAGNGAGTTRVITDAAGAFRVTGVADGEHWVAVDHDEWILAGQAARIVVEDGRPMDDVKVYIGRGGVVEGRVYDPATDLGIAGATIWIRSQASEPTGRDGRFRLGGLPAGTHPVRCATAPGTPQVRSEQWPTVRVELGGLHPIEIPIPMGVPVAGYVVDSDGTPVAAAAVWSHEKGGASNRAISAADGAYTLHGHQPGEILALFATKAGYQRVERQEMLVPDGGLADIVLRMKPAARVRGRVVDEDKRPVPGALVSVAPAGAGFFGASPAAQVFTDAAGEFEAATIEDESVEAGTVSICANYPGSVGEGWRVCKPVRVAVGEIAIVAIELPRLEAYPLTGTVRDTTGKPLAGVQVSAQSKVQPEGLRFRFFGTDFSAGTQTDGAGRFELTVHSPGAYSVQATGRGVQAAAVEAQAGDTHIEMVLEASGTIEGRVVSAKTGQPISQFELIRMNESGSVQLPQWARNAFQPYYDPEGRFGLSGVNAGPVTVFARAPGMAVTAEVVKVAAGETVRDVVLRVAEGATVVGTVKTPEGAPVAGALVFVGDFPENFEQVNEHDAVTDSSGFYVLDHLPAGSTRISAYHAGYALAGRTLNVNAGREHTVDIRLSAGGVVSGRVLQGDRPAPYARVNVSLRDGGIHREGVVGGDGRYTIQGLRSGAYHARATAHDPHVPTQHQSMSAEVDVEDGYVTRLDFSMPARAVTLEGIVTSDDTSPMRPFLSGEVTTSLGEVVYFQMVLPEGEERYRLEGLPAGIVHLGVSVSSGTRRDNFSQSAQLDATGGGTFRQDFHFRAAGTLDGVVLGAFTAPLTMAIAPGEIAWNVGSAAAFMARLQELGKRMFVNPGSQRFGISPIEQGRYTLFVLGEDKGKVVLDYAVIDIDATPARVELRLREH
jgi:hypothetical protein